MKVTLRLKKRSSVVIVPSADIVSVSSNVGIAGIGWRNHRPHHHHLHHPPHLHLTQTTVKEVTTNIVAATNRHHRPPHLKNHLILTTVAVNEEERRSVITSVDGAPPRPHLEEGKARAPRPKMRPTTRLVWYACKTRTHGVFIIQAAFNILCSIRHLFSVARVNLNLNVTVVRTSAVRTRNAAMLASVCLMIILKRQHLLTTRCATHVVFLLRYHRSYLVVFVVVTFRYGRT